MGLGMNPLWIMGDYYINFVKVQFQCFILIRENFCTSPYWGSLYTQPKLSFLLTTRAKSCHQILLFRLKSLLLLTKQKRSSMIASLLGGNEDTESPWLQVPAKPKLLINVFTHMAHVKNKQTVQAAEF